MYTANTSSLERMLNLQSRTCAELRWLASPEMGEKLRHAIELLTCLEHSNTAEEAARYTDELVPPLFDQSLCKHVEAVLASTCRREERFIVFRTYLSAYKLVLNAFLDAHVRLLGERLRAVAEYADMHRRVAFDTALLQAAKLGTNVHTTS